MYGAIIGDIVGSVYEFNNIKTKEFPLFSEGSTFTDDTIMTVAVARALLKAKNERFSFKHHLINEMRNMGRRFPNPTGGYGGNFARWLNSSKPKPYNSFGNGSAMRVSPCGLIADLNEASELAKASAEVILPKMIAKNYIICLNMIYSDLLLSTKYSPMFLYLKYTPMVEINSFIRSFLHSGLLLTSIYRHNSCVVEIKACPRALLYFNI